MSAGKRHSASRFDLELDLHGLSAEDAIRKLDDTVYKASPSSVLIIHGKGDGVLRRAVRRHLAEQEYVREIVNGEDFNYPGEAGVTIFYTRG